MIKHNCICIKMNQLFIFVIFVACFHALSGERWDTSINQQRNYNLYDFNDNCTAAGIMCKSCKELVQCVEVNPGKFETIHLQDCDTAHGITCLGKQCSNETNPRCNNEKVPDFVCSSTGIFPDPYDCRRYHFCAQPEDTIDGITRKPIDLKCLDNYGYDPITTYCKTVLKDGFCPSTPPIPRCKAAGESAAIINTSIYYICLYDKNVLLPHLYMCPHGKKYINFKCS